MWCHFWQNAHSKQDDEVVWNRSKTCELLLAWSMQSTGSNIPSNLNVEQSSWRNIYFFLPLWSTHFFIRIQVGMNTNIMVQPIDLFKYTALQESNISNKCTQKTTVWFYCLIFSYRELIKIFYKYNIIPF